MIVAPNQGGDTMKFEIRTSESSERQEAPRVASLRIDSHSGQLYLLIDERVVLTVYRDGVIDTGYESVINGSLKAGIIK